MEKVDDFSVVFFTVFLLSVMIVLRRSMKAAVLQRCKWLYIRLPKDISMMKIPDCIIPR